MDDFSDKISSILSDPESMGKILNVVKAMSGGGALADNENNGSNDSELKNDISAVLDKEGIGEEKANEDKKSPVGALLSSPELEKLFGNGNKERCALLMSMRPFLASSKRSRIDEIVRTLKLIDMFYGAKEFL